MDVAKCFGIFAIYLGHYRYSTGNAFNFVFAYHVPLFFLLSGCVESLNPDTSLKTCIRKTLRGIFLPWFIFCLLSVVVYALENDSALLDMWPMIWKTGKGTLRNTYFGGPVVFDLPWMHEDPVLPDQSSDLRCVRRAVPGFSDIRGY